MSYISQPDVLGMIEKMSDSVSDWLRKNGTDEQLLAALDQAPTEETLIIISDALGRRKAPLATKRLVTLLNHSSPKVRSSAADALAKIADPNTGEALLSRLLLPDPNLGVRRMLLVALGAVNHRQAIPLLIEWLENPDPSQRGSAAWSLGAMKAPEALVALKRALQKERIQYPRERISQAIAKISATE